MPDTLYQSMLTSNGLSSFENTPEQITKAMRAIAGSKFCRGPEDAKIILETLGLIEPFTPKAQSHVHTTEYGRVVYPKRDKHG